MKTVFMFSGQGAQYAGMGKELYDNYQEAREIFDKADEVLGYSIKELCFTDEGKLGETEYAQPAILTMSIAAMKVIEARGVQADMTAGLSLGEYTAYVASGAMDFAEAVALVQKRGRYMTEAVPLGEGAMYAIIGMDTEKVEEVCAEASDMGLGMCVPANYNAPGQIVIAGHTKAVDAAAKLAKEKGAKLAVKLKVSGPFHTSLLQPAADKLTPELEKMTISPMKIPVYTNVTGQVVPDAKEIIPILSKQVVSPVKWEDTIRNMEQAGADTFIELGPGKALTGFVKRTLKGVTILNVEDISSLEKAIEKLNA